MWYMKKSECPRCQEASISTIDKIIAGKWKSIYCPSCNQRLAAHPIVLALLYFAHVWNVMLFGFLAVYYRSWLYALIMLVIGIILEVFIYFVPLACLRPKESTQKTKPQNAK